MCHSAYAVQKMRRDKAGNKIVKEIHDAVKAALDAKKTEKVRKRRAVRVALRGRVRARLSRGATHPLMETHVVWCALCASGGQEHGQADGGQADQGGAEG